MKMLSDAVMFETDIRKAMKDNLRDLISQHHTGGSSEGVGITPEVPDESQAKSIDTNKRADERTESDKETTESGKNDDDISIDLDETNDEEYVHVDDETQRDKYGHEDEYVHEDHEYVHEEEEHVHYYVEEELNDVEIAKTVKDQRLKKRKKSKDVKPSKKPTSAGSSKGTNQSQPKSTGKSVQAEETIFEATDNDMPLNQRDGMSNTNEQPDVKAIIKDDWFKKLARPPTPNPEWNT
uniref:Uncharacterized protein n=1 Tax=Tanacetum cinerariifolium TaxID=118510 RepID=A0A699GV29_TANCI|nr:hypothetical protein [Tanacetum cinerariifolium]